MLYRDLNEGRLQRDGWRFRAWYCSLALLQSRGRHGTLLGLQRKILQRVGVVDLVCTADSAPERSSLSEPRAGHSAQPLFQDQRHHDVVPPEISSRIFRPAARFHRTRLLQLRDTDLIDEPQLDTACRWRADHDRAHASFGLTSGYLPKIDSAPPGALQAHRLDALRRLRETAAALGRWRTLLLERLVAFDDSLAGPRQAAAVFPSDGTAAPGRNPGRAVRASQSGRPVPEENLTKRYNLR